MASSEKRPLPLGSSGFGALRRAGEIYVDKTAMIHELACERRKIFLSRPRRFGKSLLISTFESLFKYGLRDFHGLAIEKLWRDEGVYRVIRLDFSRLKDFASAQDFNRVLDEYLIDKMVLEKIESPIQTRTEGLRAFNGWLSVQPENSVVLLIDEYDAPLTACLGDKKRFEQVRLRLSRLYSAVKENEGSLRFFFITGIMKFGKASIFSELNNLMDISLTYEYGTLLGYTREEVETYFSYYLEHASKVLELNQDKLFDELLSFYDGFCFEETGKTHVFSPWSLLNFFASPSRGFQNYWADSAGNPTVLQQYLKEHSISDPEEYFRTKYVPRSQLTARAIEFENLNDIVLLTFSGYLTIKAPDSDDFLVGYPNKEVSDALAWLYRDRLLSGRTLGQSGASNLKEDICDGNVESLIGKLNKLFLVMDYKKYPIVDEISCRNYMQLFLTLGTGIRVYSELHNALGRSDLEIETEHLHWVIEMKFLPAETASAAVAERLLKTALKQMREKRYGEVDLAGRKLIRIGAVFSGKERQIVRFEEI